MGTVRSFDQLVASIGRDILPMSLFFYDAWLDRFGRFFGARGRGLFRWQSCVSEQWSEVLCGPFGRLWRIAADYVRTISKRTHQHRHDQKTKECHMIAGQLADSEQNRLASGTTSDELVEDASKSAENTRLQAIGRFGWGAMVFYRS